MKKTLLINMILSIAVVAHAFEPSQVSTKYFGPNAFPIPDMLDGTVAKTLSLDVAGDYFCKTTSHDWTMDVFGKLRIPLFTERVNVSVWMPFVEWYDSEISGRGNGVGDVYLTTDIQICREYRFVPSFTTRIALKTASGEQAPKKRHYDVPGYWFDGAAGKSFFFNKKGYVPFGQRENAAIELRIAATMGFLCWQTDEDSQNDAVYYGAQIALRTKYLRLEETFSGYSGWENDGDKPQSIKTKVGILLGRLEPYLLYQYGIRDYPFHQFRIGVSYQWDILKKNKK